MVVRQMKGSIYLWLFFWEEFQKKKKVTYIQNFNILTRVVSLHNYFLINSLKLILNHLYMNFNFPVDP